MNKELKVIDFYCKKCKKSMKVSYIVTGNRNYPVLPRVMMKCHHCGRVMTLKNFKELPIYFLSVCLKSDFCREKGEKF